MWNRQQQPDRLQRPRADAVRGLLCAASILALAALLTSCYLPFGEPNRADRIRDLVRRVDEAVAAEEDNELLERASALRALDPAPAVAARVDALAVAAASKLGDENALATWLERLNVSLTELGRSDRQTVTANERDQVRQLAEESLRLSHQQLFERWSGRGTEQTTELLVRCFQIYETHFGSALLVADVLWNQAEFLRRQGESLAAVPLYEEIQSKDFSGNYTLRAVERVEQIWSMASESTPLPRDLEERMEVASPHKEWIAQAEREIALEPESPVAFEMELRIAEIQLAYRQVDEAYGTLRSIIDRGNEHVAVKAASVLLQHIADHSASSRDFKQARKELQANKVLWNNKEFRKLTQDLRRQVEGK